MNSIRCSQCKHYIVANAGEGKIYGCDRSKCVFEPTTKNDLGVDCISREQALKELKESAEHHANDSREEALLRRDRDIIKALPSVTPQLSIPEVTALAEWTEKLTEECEEAYNKGYADGMKAQEPKTGHWIRVTDKTGHLVWECDKCGWQQRFNTNYCPDCSADMREVEE